MRPSILIKLLFIPMAVLIFSFNVLAQSDMEKFAEGRVALDKFNDCPAALKALEGVSQQGRGEPLWVYYMARTQECLGKTEAALDFYQKYNSLVPGQMPVIEKIAELRYKVRKNAEIAAAAAAKERERLASEAAKERMTYTVRDTHNGVTLGSIAFSPDGQILAVSSYHRIVLFNVASGNVLKTLEQYKGNYVGQGDYQALAFSPDGSTLVSNGASYWDEDGHLYFWDIASGRVRKKVKGHTGIINSIAYSRDGRFIASASDDRTVILWDASGGRKLTFNNNDKFNSVAFSPDGRVLAAASDDTTVKLWEISSGKALGVLDQHNGKVTSVSFSQDGRYLASISKDANGGCQAKLWDATNRALLHNLKITDGCFTGVVEFSPDSKLLAMAGQSSIYLWDIQNQAWKPSFISTKGYGDSSNHTCTLSFSRDGRILASGCHGVARVWYLERN